jgi:hypothetical protein
MKFLKSFKLFESTESVDHPILDFLYDLSDEGIDVKLLPVKENHIAIGIGDCDESEVSKIINRINDSGDFEVRYTKVGEVYYVFDYELIKKFLYLIKDLKRVGNDFVDGSEILMRQDSKNGYFRVRYSKIWSIFESFFPGNYKYQQGFMSSLVEEAFKFRPLTPKHWQLQKQCWWRRLSNLDH